MCLSSKLFLKDMCFGVYESLKVGVKKFWFVSICPRKFTAVLTLNITLVLVPGGLHY